MALRCLAVGPRRDRPSAQTQPDLAPLPNIQGSNQGDSEQQQQQHRSELETGAACAMHKPNLSQPMMLDPDPGIGIETEYVGKPQPQAPLELGASEPKGQWYSKGLVSAAMIVSLLALVVSLWLLPWIPVKSFLGGAVGCVPSLPMLTSRYVFASLPSTPLRSLAWQASELVGAVIAVPVLGLAVMSGLALGAHCWFWLR